MCGIFGIITSKQSPYSEDFLSESLKQLALLSESRGKDSSGLCTFNQIENRIEIVKGPIPIKQLFKQKAIKQNVSSAFSMQEHANYAFGHARLVTNGTQLNDANNELIAVFGSGFSLYQLTRPLLIFAFGFFFSSLCLIIYRFVISS